jgi:FtsH-binding integral membrane protein
MAALGGHAYAQKIRSRIARTYGYLTGSVVLTAATSWILFTRGYGLRVLMMNPWMYGLGTMVAAWGAIWMTMSLSYQHNPMAKHAAWALTNGLIGFSLLGLSTLAGGLIVRQAAMITGCIVGSLSLAAMAAPNDTFLRMGPYLGVGLGVVIAASLGGMFFPASTLLYNVSLYGGLAVFGLYVAHDSQKVLHDAQVVPQFDPIGEQMGIYLDTINIFVRVVQILMMQQRKK